jgi:hypothetical protein
VISSPRLPCQPFPRAHLGPLRSNGTIYVTSRDSLHKDSTLIRIALISSKLIAYWLLGCALQWVFYGMAMQVQNTNRTRLLALELVMGMSFVISVLTAGAWLICSRTSKETRTLWMRLAKAFSCTAVVLVAYSALVLMRRNLWTQAQGMSVYDQFLPVVGRINAEFFGEFNWLTFLTEVIPVMSLSSAVLLNINSRMKLSAD